VLVSWPSWDLQLLLAVNGEGHPVLTAAMRAVSNVDNWVPVILAAACALLWMGRTRPRLIPEGTGRRWSATRNPRTVLFCLLLAAGLSDQVCYHLKHAVSRSRPCFDTEVCQLVEYRGEVHGDRSFPSAHAANSAALATLTALAYPPLAVPAVLTSAVVGFSRVYLGVHYPLDVLAGWGIGVLCASVVWLLLRKCSRRAGLIGFTNRFRIRQPHLHGPLPPGWREVGLTSLDGYPMTGLFVEGGGDIAVLVHGLHEDVRVLAAPGRAFHEMGFSVLAVPMRGHDGHPLAVTTGGPAEAYDVLGALDHAAGAMGFERRRTVLYGSSMGAAVAMKAAGLLGEPLAGVILHAPYESFFGHARKRLGSFRTALLKRLLPLTARSGLDAFRPLDYARMASGTLFVILSGTLDRISPPSVCAAMARRLPGSAHLISEGAGHPVWTRGDRSPAAFREALRQALEHLSGNLSRASCVDDSGTVRNLRVIPEEMERRGGE
jgi:membrane-associated phospholipid phosphatase/pimeloyl-ACP methyl ester carboxylesterase